MHFNIYEVSAMGNFSSGCIVSYSSSKLPDNITSLVDIEANNSVLQQMIKQGSKQKSCLRIPIILETFETIQNQIQ